MFTGHYEMSEQVQSYSGGRRTGKLPVYKKTHFKTSSMLPPPKKPVPIFKLPMTTRHTANQKKDEAKEVDLKDLLADFE